MAASAPSGDWPGLVLAGYYTGARIGDLSNLRWSAVDLERGVVVFVQSKTERRIEIPVHPELEKWLLAVPGAGRVGDVFPSLAGKTSSGRNGLSGQFRRIMDRAGTEPEITGRAGEKGRNRSSLSFHSLRHSFNSAMANAGVTQEIRQRLTGHVSKAINDRYTHAELETLRKAVDAVPTLGG
jgi:integrase